MKRNNPNRRLVFWVALVATAALILGSTGGPAAAQTAPRTFPETGQTVQGQFLDYWNAHGGLAQQGYPISDEMQERNATDGQTYTVQYFERAVFEQHPENAPPYDVLLSPAGRVPLQPEVCRRRAGPDAEHRRRLAPVPRDGQALAARSWPTGSAHGGLAQQGFPISDEFAEKSGAGRHDVHGAVLRARRVRVAPGERGTPYEVLLAQLGTFRYRAGQLPPTATAPAVAPTAEPTAPPRVQAIPQSGGVCRRPRQV